jgi:hypothetical protein
MELMKPFKHIKVVTVDPKREFCTIQSLHMNNVGRERTSLKIVNVILTVLHNQTSEPIKLHWKTECEEGASPTSGGDNTFIQEDPKPAAADNEKIISYVGDLKAQPEELSGSMSGRTQHANMENRI